MRPGCSEPGRSRALRACRGIVLAGGSASRLSGIDKVTVEIGGRTLLDGVLGALAGVEPVVVVGPPRPVARTVTWTREDPAGGGPTAGLAAGMAALPDDPPAGETTVALLAADLVGVTVATIDRLREACAADETTDGALLIDDGGNRQWLIGVWRRSALLAGLPAEPAGRSLRSVLGELSVREVPQRPGESDDIDTPSDVERSGGALPPPER